MITLYLIACIFFLVLQAFFCACEISFISSNIVKLRHNQDRGDKKSKRVYKLILNPEQFLATTLVGINLAVILSSSFLTLFFMRLGVESSSIWVTFIYTPIVVIFAELIPKNVGISYKELISCKLVGVFEFFEKIFFPIVVSVTAMSKFLVNTIVKKKKYRSPFVTKEEIRSLVKEVQQQGGIDRGEQEAIEEVFDFRSDKIKDVCLEIKNVVGFDYTDSYELIIDIIKKQEYTRYPIFKDQQVIGYINIYDLFYRNKKNWQELIRPITKVGFNQKLQEIFTRLKTNKESIALVIKGKKDYGIITIGDLIREIITSIIKI